MLKYYLTTKDIIYALVKFIIPCFLLWKRFLNLKKKSSKKHGWTMNLFSKEYVQTNEFPKDIAKLYFRSEKKWMDADYESILQFNRKQTENSIKDGEIFLKECKKYLKFF